MKIQQQIPQEKTRLEHRYGKSKTYAQKREYFINTPFFKDIQRHGEENEKKLWEIDKNGKSIITNI